MGRGQRSRSQPYRWRIERTSTLATQAVKFLYVDQQCPDINVAREQRIEFLKKEVPRSSIQPIFDVVPLLPSEEVREFREEVKGRWSSLSGIVHPSKE